MIPKRFLKQVIRFTLPTTLIEKDDWFWTYVWKDSDYRKLYRCMLDDDDFGQYVLCSSEICELVVLGFFGTEYNKTDRVECQVVGFKESVLVDINFINKYGKLIW